MDKKLKKVAKEIKSIERTDQKRDKLVEKGKKVMKKGC